MLYDITIPAFIKTLGNLEKILDKAAAFADSKKFAPEVLLQSRLAPDMFPMIKQIQITCDTAKLAASRLTGKDAPIHDDKEVTLADIRARIESVKNYLSNFKPEDFNGAAERKISPPRWEGKWMTGVDYVHHHVLPNFYFHTTTTYAILRHNGVEIGKKDYLGDMPFKH